MNTRSLMKNLSIGVLAIVLLSCENDENFISDTIKAQVTVQFESQGQSISENSGPRFVKVVFDKPASKAGQLQIHVDKTDNQIFSTEPEAVAGIITINVNKGDRSATIAFTPTDNVTVNDASAITLTVKEVSEPFVVGLQKKFVAIILDNESPAPVHSSRANFIVTNATIGESNTAGFALSIHLSEPTANAGIINIQVQSEKAIYGTDFTTEPALNNGLISLAVETGSSVSIFKVTPVSNGKITGELKITFTIAETAGSIIKGDNLTQDIQISDAELALKPKSYEIGGGSWGLKKLFEYDEVGRVSLVKWDSHTPYHRSGTDSYFYESGLLARIKKGDAEEITYASKNNKITKSERFVNSLLKQYIEYDYDDHGNISGTADYYRQPDGSFALGFLTVYLYFENGNLYKQLRYVPAAETEDYILISTNTYDGYIDVSNPFPMVVIIPTVKSQKTLPTSYRVEENGKDVMYNLSYEFLSDGRPGKRIASGPDGNEIAVYEYY